MTNCGSMYPTSGGRTRRNRMRGGTTRIPANPAFAAGFAPLQQGPESVGPKGWDSGSKLVAEASSPLGDFGAGAARTPMSDPYAVAGDGSPSPFASTLGGGRRRRGTRKGMRRKTARLAYSKRHGKGGLSSQLVPWGLTGALLMTPKRHKGRHHYPHKGQRSRTRPGRLDFITHKGDKMYNRRGKRQRTNKKGTRRRPFA